VSHSPTVATVILNYRCTEDTVSAVEALRRSTVLDQQVIVCDNAAADEADADLPARLGEGVTVIVTGGNLGYAGGNNVGIRHALESRPAFVWLLNPDTEVEPDTLERLLATAAAFPDAGALGPRIFHTGRSRIWYDGGVVDPQTLGNTAHLNAGRPPRSTPASAPRDVDYVTGAAMLLRRAVLDRVGLLPEQYFLYFEETSYCAALQAAGWRTMIDPRATMVHHKRSSAALPTCAYLYYMTRNRLHFGREQFGADAEQVLPHWERAFLQPWRDRVEQVAPQWVCTFDAIVEQAVRDARAGRYGVLAELDQYPDPAATEAPEHEVTR
jgi:GT2 family glycosyltransferase